MTNEHRGVGRARLDAAEAALGLEMLFADVASGPLRPDLPLAPAVRMAAALAGRPLTVARRGAGLAAELARIGLGRSTLAPSPHDERYADPAWSDNPLLRRFVQAHIAAGAIASDLIADARLDGPDDERIRAAVTALVDALAPSNTPLNPAVWRAALGGESAVRGVARRAGDLAASPRVPAAPGALRVRGGHGRRRHSRCRRSPHACRRADPVPAADRGGPRPAPAGRAADGHPVLPGRPGAQAQHRRAPRPRRPAGVPPVVAQPRPRARRLGPRHLRPGRPRRDGRV